MEGRMVFWLTVYYFSLFITVSQEAYPGCQLQSLVGPNKLNVPDNNYNASSSFDYRYAPQNAKLDGKYGWAPKDNSNPDDYLQIDLGTPRVITAVATQGNGGDPNDSNHSEKMEWVKSYNLSFANDTKKWTRCKQVRGNNDANGIETHDLRPPITAKYIKFIPLTYKTYKTMRVNVYVFSHLQDAPSVKAIPWRRSINLTWTITSCSLLTITGYTIRVDVKDTNVKSNERRFQIKGLKTYTEYNVSVKARTEKGDGIWSIVERIRTMMEEPTAVPNFSIKAASSNSITIKLKKPASDKINGPFEGYRITCTPRGGKTKRQDVGNVTTFALKSLLKYTTYSITVAVRNKKYIGPPSKELKVRTLEDAPSAPVNLDHSFKPANGLARPRVVITWERPLQANGIIRNYTIIYYYNKKDTSTKVIVTNKEAGTTNPLKYTVTVMCSGTFSYSIKASTIKEGPYAVGKRITIPEYRCPEQSLVGKEKNLNIPNSSYTASSRYDNEHQPHNAKLYGKYGWAPKDNSNPDDYLQIDLGTPRVITAVATQGSGGDPDDKDHKVNKEWVSSYRLKYSINVSNWSSYKNDSHKFSGNTDTSSVIRNDLENPIIARYIRFVPAEYHGYKTMRVNVYVAFQEAPNITLVHVGERLIELSWSVKKCSPAYPIEGYTVKVVGQTGAREINTSGLENNMKINKLKPYTEYNVSVRAIRQVQYGAWSNVTTTRTAIAKPETFPVDIKVKAEQLQSITVQWKLEKVDLIHGPFKGYRITYTPEEGKAKTQDVDRNVVEEHPAYTLKSLLKYTKYSVYVAVRNENYVGPKRKARDTISTLEDKPDKAPDIITIKPRSSESIFLEWKKVHSHDVNGIFKAYRIFYTPQGGRTKTIDVGDVAAYNLTSLLKYTTYTVTIAVMNEVFVGPQSKKESTRTLQDAPSAPVNVNGTLIPPQYSFGLRVNITWGTPRYPNGIIRRYNIIYYYNEDTSNKENVTINKTSDLQYIMNVTDRGELLFHISATTIKEGPYESGNIAIPSDRKGSHKRNIQDSGSSASGGLIAGIVVGIILVLLFLALAFSIWKRKRTQSERYEAAEPLPLELVDDAPSSATCNNYICVNEEITHELAPPALFPQMERHRVPRSFSRPRASVQPPKRPIKFPAPDINKLKEEFKGVPVEPSFDSKEGMKPGNKAKNRYKNIIAYDHSLVTLEWVYGETESFYINANYIHDYDGTPEVYIATQGPLDTTLNDFWRMIWEQKVTSIVMLTNLRELGKKKCYQYWPDDSDQYLDITVTNHKTEVFADFAIRTFFLSKAGSPNRRVRQFHFTAWPDKGVPDHATAVLSFRRKVLALSASDDSNPTVVHCSAGVGRTGTYIMIDAMLRQAEDQRHVDILNYLKTIRNDRPYMVQTVEQYIFVNMAIYDALTCGNTEVPVENLLYAIQQLSSVDRHHKLSGYALEFQRLEDVTLEDTQSGNFDVGLSRKNARKNRYPDIVAASSNRVIISTDDDTEIGDYINSSVIEAYKERKGDYINASFVDTYREHNAFIMTQAPMENTIADFWRMVMDYNIGTVVMLNNLEEECEVFPQYWPLHETKSYEGTKVQLVKTKHLPGNILLRILEVSNRRKQFTVKHFQHLTWENKCVPMDAQSVLKLLHEVQKSQQKSGNSPIVVQCNNGVGRSGTFCAIASCLERVKQEQVLDVFQTIKSIRVNRPGAVETLTQYIFCYNIIQKYLDSFRDYANFGDI